MSTDNPKEILMAWSSGKDSALALQRLLARSDVHVCGLLTTVSAGSRRVTIHGVRHDILRQQAASTGLDLCEVEIPPDCSDDVYGAAMREAMMPYVRRGVKDVAFGDVFLENIREYRQSKLDQLGMKAIFPLWDLDTQELARSFIRDGFKAIITSVDGQALDRSFAGRGFDEQLLADLPDDVDPCGENGEFHTLVYSGPIFRRPINVTPGHVTMRNKRFYDCDVTVT